MHARRQCGAAARGRCGDAGRTGQAIDRTTPPSTRKAAPVVADACVLHTYATIAATSAVAVMRLITELGRAVAKNSRSIVAVSTPRAAASCATKAPTPSEEVGPGSTQMTVTPVPAMVSARPRATASCAVLLTP